MKGGRCFWAAWRSHCQMTGRPAKLERELESEYANECEESSTLICDFYLRMGLQFNHTLSRVSGDGLL